MQELHDILLRPNVADSEHGMLEHVKNDSRIVLLQFLSPHCYSRSRWRSQRPTAGKKFGTVG